MTDPDGHRAKEVHPKSVDIGNDHANEADDTTKAEVHTAMQDPEAEIEIHRERVVSVTVAMIITVKGDESVLLLLLRRVNNEVFFSFHHRSNRPRNKSPDNSGDPSESSKRR